jgi:hypothetical protein
MPQRDHTQIDRRKLMIGSGAAVLATAAVVPVTAQANDDDALMGLWKRFIAAEALFAGAAAAEDEASFRARDEHHALVCPWTPLEADHWESKAVEISRGHKVIEMKVADTTELRGGMGPWRVKEYQPKAETYPFVSYREGYPVRWQPYPEAGRDEAYAMATARAEKEWRSFDGRRAAISRKYQVRKIEAAAKAANHACQILRYEIAIAPVTSALARAIKLGVRVYDQGMDNRPPKPSYCFDEQGAAATMSVYRHAVAECGFDPAATARTAMRKCERANATKAVA